MSSNTSILINVGAEVTSALRGLGQVEGALDRQMTASEKMGRSIKKAAVPAAAALAGLGAAAVGFAKSAADDAAAAERLAGNLKNSTGATDAQVAAVEDWITAQGKAYGVADDKLRPAMERLSRSTGDVAEAQKLATLAMDIAGSTGKDVETVSNALAKANDGNVNALKKLGVTLGPVTSNYGDYIKAQQKVLKAQDDANAAISAYGPNSEQAKKALDKVALAESDVAAMAKQGTDWMGELGGQFKGGASAQAETAAGRMERFQLALSETGESIGAVLLPALETMLGPLQTFASWAQDNSTAVAVIGGVIAALAATIVILNVAMTVAAAVTTAWGIAVAIATSPITLIVLAILAVIAVVVLLYKNWDTVIAWLKKAWQSVSDKAKDIWGGLKDWFARTWDTIKTKLSDAWEGIKSAVSTGIDNVVTFVKELPGKVVSALANIGTVLLQKGKDLLTGLWDGVKFVWELAKTWFIDLPIKALQAIGAIERSLFQKGIDLLTGLWDGIKNVWASVKSWFEGRAGAAVSAIGALGSTLFSKGKDLLDGLWDGIKDKWTSVKEWFEDIPSKVKTAIGGLGSALYQKGRDLIDGFVNGIKSMGNAILNAILSLLPNSIEGIVRKAIGFSGGAGAPAVSSFSARSSRSLDGGSRAPVVTDEQLARAVYSLLMRSGIRNGVQTAVVL